MTEEEIQKLMEELSTQGVFKPPPVGPALQHTEEGYPFYSPDASTIQLPPIDVTAEEELKKLGAPQPEPVEVVEPTPGGFEPSPTESILPEVSKAIEPVRQVVSKGLGSVAKFPWDVGAAFTGMPAAINAMLGDTQTAERMMGVSDWLTRQGKGAQSSMDWLVGAKPHGETPVEKLGELAGESIIPAKKAAVPLTLGLTGMRAVAGGLAPTAAEAAPLKEQYDLVGIQPPDYQQVAAAAQAPPSARRTTPRLAGKPTPTSNRILDTVAGKYQVKDSDYRAMGALGAATLFAMFAPTVFPKLMAGIRTLGFGARRARAVRDAAPGTTDITTPFDYARTADDMTAAATRVAKGAGMDPRSVEQVENTFRIQTRGAARGYTDSAVQEGHFETPAFRFQTPVSLANQARSATPEIRQYLNLLDTVDELNLLNQPTRLAARVTQNPTAGPPTVAGMNLQQAIQMQGAMERAHPEVRIAANAYRAHVKAVRKFESTGEYATRPANNPNVTGQPHTANRSVAFLNQLRPNEVPFRGSRDVGIPLNQREDPFTAQEFHTKLALRQRMENEAVGQYVDAMRRTNPNLFVRVTDAQLEQNPRWQKNVVSFYRRGVQEHYTTSPLLRDVLKMDPYILTGMVPQVVHGLARGLEFGTTGMGAPAFSFISLLRNWQISKFAAERGFRSPGIMRSLYAVPQQLYPQIARFISQSLENNSANTLSSWFGRQWVDGLAQRLAQHYDQSLFARLKEVGSSRGSILEHQVQTQAMNRASAVFQRVGGPARDFWNAWKATWEAVHNGPGFAYVQKNLGVKPLPELAMRARRLTGDPRTGGQYYTYGRSGKEAPIRFEGDTLASRVTHTALRYGYAAPMEAGRTAIPWFNATLQGIKRIGEAYLHDPVGFTAKLWLYVGAPTASNYFYNRSLGKDPHGRSYSDYQLNGRSAYNSQMNWYFGIPGQPVENGVEIPGVHELNGFKRMLEVSLDHAMGGNIHSLNDDFWKAAYGFFDTAIVPPTPTAVSLPFAFGGQVAPMGSFFGAFGEAPFKIKNDPYDQYRGLPPSVELVARTLGGSLAQTFGQGYAAFTNTPDGFTKALENAVKAGGKVQVQRIPIVRDVTGILPPSSGNTDTTKMLFDKQRKIDELLRFYEKWTKNLGYISVKPASKSGGSEVEKLLGPTVAEQSAGLDQPDPTNPIYNKFMQDFYNRFKKDSTVYSKNDEDEGGIAFRSMWRRYGDSTEQLRRLRSVNEGNFVTWQKQLTEDHPEAKKELKDANIDITDLREVKNYYERKRQDAARLILFTIKAVEDDFSKQLGVPFTIDMMDPYGQGLKRTVTGEVAPLTGEPAPFTFQWDVNKTQEPGQVP